jgi:hypothetical protein
VLRDNIQGITVSACRRQADAVTCFCRVVGSRSHRRRCGPRSHPLRQALGGST